MGATHGFYQPKRGRKAVIWPAEQQRDAPFGSALAEEQIGLVAKLEASSSAPTSGHPERRGMAIARKFSKDVYVLGLVQSPCLVHIFTLGQCKMHFVANMGCELPTHAAG